MDGNNSSYETVVRLAAKRLRGHQRRLFLAEATLILGQGNARQAEERFGWGRETVQKGLHELQRGVRCLENCAGRARPRWEVKQPQLAADIRAIVEPHTHADPELKSARRYTNLSAREVREALVVEELTKRLPGTAAGEVDGTLLQALEGASPEQGQQILERLQREANAQGQGSVPTIARREGGGPRMATAQAPAVLAPAVQIRRLLERAQQLAKEASLSAAVLRRIGQALAALQG